MFFTLLKIELEKIFKKGRSFIGFIAIGILVPIIQIAMYSEGNDYFNMFTQTLQQQFDFSGNLLNGYLIAFIVLQSLFVHIPLLVSLIAGDMLAGEAIAGTFRILLIRPVSRFQVISAKFIAAQIYTLLLILWVSVLSMGLSVLFFGKGELFIVASTITILPQDDILWRFILAYFYGFLSMSTVASVAFFFSGLVENSIGPIVSTMAIIIVFTIISSLDAGFIKVIKPFLFTNHLIGWRYLFEQTIDSFRILQSAIILFMHSILLFALSVYYLHKKDIMT